MKESIDTLKLKLIDYEVSPGANLMVQPPLFNYGSSEVEKKNT